jgi:hypothetical protein
MFDRSLIGMTSGEAEIAQTLRSARIDASSAQGEYLAQQIRINQALLQTRDIGREALQGIVSDLRASRDAGEIFANVLSRIGDRLANLAIDKGLSAIMGGPSTGGGGIFDMITAFMGFRADGGPVTGGRAYVVGERGKPEVFVPDQSGSIVPMPRNGGGSPIIIHQQFSSTFQGMSGSDRQWAESRMQQVAAQAKAAAIAEISRMPQRR